MLKERIAAKEDINVALASFTMSDDALKAAVTKESYDLVFLDGQHSALNEEAVPAFCAKANALGVPVLFRIKHNELAFLTGNYLDLGPLGIVIPQVEDPRSVQQAIDNFYYPPVGKRGWGPTHAYGKENIADRREYADWWNRTGILGIQLESVHAIRNAKTFVLPGVDMVMYGPKDLSFSLEAEGDDPFGSIEECYAFAESELADSSVKVTRGGNPFGRL